MLAVLLSLVPQAPAAELDAWRDHIAEAPTESRWLEIGWRASVGDGLRAAAAGDRPLLLWLMNGHPLGCT